MLPMEESWRPLALSNDRGGVYCGTASWQTPNVSLNLPDINYTTAGTSPVWEVFDRCRLNKIWMDSHMTKWEKLLRVFLLILDTKLP